MFCILTWVVTSQVCASEKKKIYELCHKMSILNCLHVIYYLKRMFLECEGGKDANRGVCWGSCSEALQRWRQKEKNEAAPAVHLKLLPSGPTVILWDVSTLTEHQPQMRSLWDLETVRHSKATSQLCLSPDKTRSPCDPQNTKHTSSLRTLLSQMNYRYVFTNYSCIMFLVSPLCGRDLLRSPIIVLPPLCSSAQPSEPLLP